MTKQEQAMRLYEVIELLSLQAGEDVDETVEWLCESGGMAKLFLYFSPIQPRTWVDLTDDDIGKVCGFAEHTSNSTRFALQAISRAIEAKIKEKNT